MKLPSTKQVICSAPESVFPFFGWPTVARLPGGELAMTCSGFRLKHSCSFGKVVICYSRNEGKTWTQPAVLIDTLLDDRDAGIASFGNGRVIVTSFNLSSWRILEDISPWATPEQRALIEAYIDYVRESYQPDTHFGYPYRISEDGGFTFGPQKMGKTAAPHGPIVLNDGSLLYVGFAIAYDLTYNDQVTPPLQCWKFNEQDEFVLFSTMEHVYDEHGWICPSEPHGVQLPDGKIVVHFRATRLGEPEKPRKYMVYQCESLDGGRTFSKAHPIMDDELGGSPPHLLLHSSGCLISSYGYREHPCGIRVMLSMDNGETWSAPYTIEDGCQGGDEGYPATVELKDGSLLTVYYESVYASDKPEKSSIMQRIWRLPSSILPPSPESECHPGLE